MPPLLSLDQLARPGLAPVSQTVEAGARVMIGGPSGAGKTLLLRAIADLDPHSGDMRLDGIPCRAMAPTQWRRQVGYLPSESHWWADRVAEHFNRVDLELLATLGFSREALDWPVRRLSSGERQRLALARVLSLEPRVLLLDEPTANLDPDNSARIEQLIHDYCEERAAAALWVSHDPQQRARLASRQWQLEAGRLTEVAREVAA